MYLPITDPYVWCIWCHIYHQYIPVLLAYIPYDWILWVVGGAPKKSFAFSCWGELITQ